MGNEILEGGMEGSSGANKIQETNRSELLIEEKYPNRKYMKSSNANEVDRGSPTKRTLR
jgi:hypothetical protein